MPNANSVFKKIAHRGASGEAPENTIPAFELAFQKYHCDMVEMDVRLTRDGMPVVFHDKTLERITGQEGLVSQFSLREIKEFDAAYKFDPKGNGEFPFRGKGTTIPTLQEVLSHFPDSGFCVELKGRDKRIVHQTLEVLNRIPNKSRLIIGSFEGKIARLLRRICDQSFETFLTEDEIILAFTAFRLGLKKIPLPARQASLPMEKYRVRLDGVRWIEFLHRQGAHVFYWTVNDINEMKELIARGADGILTDYPDKLGTISKSAGFNRS